MSNTDKPDPDSDSSAADEPTAMWDADALKGLGLEEAAKSHQEPAAPRPAPRVEPNRLAAAPTTKVPVRRPAARSKSQGPSWAAVIGLAAVVGVGVYALVRFLLS